jgi:hypothetical protein
MKRALWLLPLLALTALAAPPPPDLTDFRTWHRATKEPFQISDVIAARCAIVPADQDFYRRTGKEPPQFTYFPHRNYFVNVYVNEVGRKSMNLQGKPFPVGSFIVKEKFRGKYIQNKLKFDSPTLLTVMRKREVGFDTKNGDWEYFIGDPGSLKLQIPAPKKLADCQSCHQNYKDRDFVTKSYLLTGREKPPK